MSLFLILTFSLALASSTIPLSVSEVKICHEGICTVEVIGHSLSAIHTGSYVHWTLLEGTNSSQRYSLHISEAYYDYTLEYQYSTTDFKYDPAIHCDCEARHNLAERSPWLYPKSCPGGAVTCGPNADLCLLQHDYTASDDCPAAGHYCFSITGTSLYEPVRVFRVKRPTKKIFVEAYEGNERVDQHLWNGVNELRLRLGELTITLPKSTHMPFYQDMVIYRHPSKHEWYYERSYNLPGRYDGNKIGWWQYDGGKTTDELIDDVKYNANEMLNHWQCHMISCRRLYADGWHEAQGLFTFLGYSMMNNTRNLRLKNLIPGIHVYDWDSPIHNSMALNEIYDDFASTSTLTAEVHRRMLTNSAYRLSTNMYCYGKGQYNQTSAIEFGHPATGGIVVQDSEGVIPIDRTFFIRSCDSSFNACKMSSLVDSELSISCEPDHDELLLRNYIFKCYGYDDHGTEGCYQFKASPQPHVTTFEVLDVSRSNSAHMILPENGAEMMDVVISGVITGLSYDIMNVIPNIRKCRYTPKGRKITFEARSSEDAGYALLTNAEGLLNGNSVNLGTNWQNYTIAVSDFNDDIELSLVISADGYDDSCLINVPGVKTAYVKDKVTNITETVTDTITDIFDNIELGWRKVKSVSKWPSWIHFTVWPAIGIGVLVIGVIGSILLGLIGNYVSGAGWLVTVIKLVLTPFSVLLNLLWGLFKWVLSKLDVVRGQITTNMRRHIRDRVANKNAEREQRKKEDAKEKEKGETETLLPNTVSRVVLPRVRAYVSGYEE